MIRQSSLSSTSSTTGVVIAIGSGSWRPRVIQTPYRSPRLNGWRQRLRRDPVERFSVASGNATVVVRLSEVVSQVHGQLNEHHVGVHQFPAEGVGKDSREVGVRLMGKPASGLDAS